MEVEAGSEPPTRWKQRDSSAWKQGMGWRCVESAGSGRRRLEGRGGGPATPKIREGAVASAVVGSHGDWCEAVDAAAGGGTLFRR